MMSSLIEHWFKGRGWRPFRFQEEAWQAYRAGESGLIISPTGAGKSYAAMLGPLQEWIDQHPDHEAWSKLKPPPLTLLWITPMRALAADTEESLRQPIVELGLPWSIGRRTGDTSSSERQKQKGQLPTLLITTPESLSLFLSYSDSFEKFRALQAVVVDEWHELMGSKRGVQTELCLARLRHWQPEMRVWGLSATIGNPETALACLLGNNHRGKGRSINGQLEKPYEVESLIPEAIERFPWAGHLGLKMLPQVVNAIEQAGSTLVFTNTRAQSETWYQALLETRPEWAGILAIHHGSLDRKTREWVEESLRTGVVRCVVCTSSLDLGVDFSPVDQVIQIGSPKGIARLMQRTGRSGHQPGAVSRVLGAPTNAFELIEFAAARRAINSISEPGQRIPIESRIPIEKPFDLLAQHLVTIGVGPGFEPEEMLREIRSSYSFRNLTDEEWRRTLEFLVSGGKSLQAYDQYRRLVLIDGILRVTDQTIAKRHRMSIGVITSDAAIQIKYLNGETLGTVEESFISRLKKGDTFIFAGRVLELVRMREMAAQVRRAKDSRAAMPRWAGGRIPLSSELAGAVLDVLGDYKRGMQEDPEIRALAPILEIQDLWSDVPIQGELVIERLTTKEGNHHFFYPFAGRLANDGLAALFALRLSRLQPITFTVAANDYGFELLSPDPLETDLNEEGVSRLLSTERLAEDIAESLNSVEMARRQFREISRVAGLVFQGYPGQGKSTKQIQASSGLLYDVFTRFEPDHLLIRQARQEVLSRQLEQHRLEATLKRLQRGKIIINEVKRPTPFAFPLLVDRLREKLSSEKLADRIKRMQLSLEKEVGKENKKR